MKGDKFMTEERIVLIDFNHQTHIIMNSKAPRFYHNVTLGSTEGAQIHDEKHSLTGRTIKVETTVPNFTIKNAFRWSRQGKDKLGVCFDSRCVFRKEYFKTDEFGNTAEQEYKGGRKPMLRDMYEGADLTLDILNKAGVSVYKADNYEADDLIYSLVQICKEKYPNTPIDIICNDADLFPLVDEQVSVWYRSRKYTYAMDKSLEKTKYCQVTPYNYKEIVGDLSSYKKFDMEYNTVLLHKLLRGDASDGIPGFIHPKTGKKDFPPKVYNTLIEYMIDDGVNLGALFRYTRFKPQETLAAVGDKKLLRTEFQKRMQEQLDEMCNILDDFVDEETIHHVRYMYGGMNLRFLNLYEPKNYNAGKLRVETSKLGIRLPLS